MIARTLTVGMSLDSQPLTINMQAAIQSELDYATTIASTDSGLYLVRKTIDGTVYIGWAYNQSPDTVSEFDAYLACYGAEQYGELLNSPSSPLTYVNYGDSMYPYITIGAPANAMAGTLGHIPLNANIMRMGTETIEDSTWGDYEWQWVEYYTGLVIAWTTRQLDNLPVSQSSVADYRATLPSTVLPEVMNTDKKPAIVLTPITADGQSLTLTLGYTSSSYMTSFTGMVETPDDPGGSTIDMGLQCVLYGYSNDYHF